MNVIALKNIMKKEHVGIKLKMNMKKEKYAMLIMQYIFGEEN